jgi:hypothetical protein
MSVRVQVLDHFDAPIQSYLYSYILPTVNSLHPSCGPYYGGEKVTIKGLHLGHHNIIGPIVLFGKYPGKYVYFLLFPCFTLIFSLSLSTHKV